MAKLWATNLGFDWAQACDAAWEGCTFRELANAVPAKSLSCVTCAAHLIHWTMHGEDQYVAVIALASNKTDMERALAFAGALRLTSFYDSDLYAGEELLRTVTHFVREVFSRSTRDLWT